jgi:hypothetical protein
MALDCQRRNAVCHSTLAVKERGTQTAAGSPPARKKRSTQLVSTAVAGEEDEEEEVNAQGVTQGAVVGMIPGCQGAMGYVMVTIGCFERVPCSRQSKLKDHNSDSDCDLRCTVGLCGLPQPGEA